MMVVDGSHSLTPTKIVSLILCFASTPFTASAPLKKTSYTVKVLIEEHHHSSPKKTPCWRIHSNAGFFLYSPNQKNSYHFFPGHTILISHHPHRLIINGKTYPHTALRVCPKNGYASVNDTPFHGSFSVMQTHKHTYLINHVDLEEYVCSVLKTESWPGWPIEVNKAFAVASRSYVVAMIKQMKKSGLPYHVKNTNVHQTYKGMHSSHPIRSAVKHTQGMVLTHNNEIALTMFDSCCGGVIPAHIADVEFEKVPYLARTYPCRYCKECRIYAWEKELHLATIHKQMAHLSDHPGVVHSINVTKKDKAGLVQEVHMKKGKHRIPISGKQMYGALKEIKSFCYAIRKKGDRLIFSGCGYGHHLGICQWGAREMVRDGWPYKRILDFYYPGTTLAQLA